MNNYTVNVYNINTFDTTKVFSQDIMADNPQDALTAVFGQKGFIIRNITRIKKNGTTSAVYGYRPNVIVVGKGNISYRYRVEYHQDIEQQTDIDKLIAKLKITNTPYTTISLEKLTITNTPYITNHTYDIKTDMLIMYTMNDKTYLYIPDNITVIDHPSKWHFTSQAIFKNISQLYLTGGRNLTSIEGLTSLLQTGSSVDNPLKLIDITKLNTDKLVRMPYFFKQLVDVDIVGLDQIKLPNVKELEGTFFDFYNPLKNIDLSNADLNKVHNLHNFAFKSSVDTLKINVPNIKGAAYAFATTQIRVLDLCDTPIHNIIHNAHMFNPATKIDILKLSDTYNHVKLSWQEQTKFDTIMKSVPKDTKVYFGEKLIC